MQKIICATGMENLDYAISQMEGFHVVYTVQDTSQLIPLIASYEPNILVLTETITAKGENLAEVIIRAKQEFPRLRIVFLSGPLDLTNEDKRSFYGTLYNAGVYDIIHEPTIKAGMVEHLLNNPNTKEDVSYLAKRQKQKVSEGFNFDAEDEEAQSATNYYPNVFSIASIKPGTGKSFTATNVATMISEYGKKKENGKFPKVALIEADLQNLSVGTLLSITGDHLKTAMNSIMGIINEHKQLEGDEGRIEDVNKTVLSCFKKYPKSSNLYALVGSELTLEQLKNVQEVHYSYLLKIAADNFDIVIVDTNSSFEHRNTFSLLTQSQTCYYVMNLDFNNVRNNMRYKSLLNDYRILERVKYVLNEDIPDSENLLFSSKDIKNKMAIDFVATIPIVDEKIFLNRIFMGTPLALDKTTDTLDARYEIAKIANEIYPLSNFSSLKREYEQAHTDEAAPKKKKFGLR